MRDDLKHNYVFNLLDAAFFGFGVGFASFSTIIPLFVNHLTASQTLIGLVPAVHNVSWMAPQLFTAGWVARTRRLKPMVLLITIHERLPFLAMGLVAFFYSRLGVPLSLAFTFTLLTWQGLGGGFTANFWQSFIAKVFPPEVRGTFIGMQAALANLTIAISSIAAGLLLDRVEYPYNFVVCFVIASIWLALSWWALAQAREQDAAPQPTELSHGPLWQSMGSIWRSDPNFRIFILVRSLAQFACMGFAFYIIFAVRHFTISQGAAGLLTAGLATSQIIANAVLGWLGDRFGNRNILIGGALTAVCSALFALFAPTYALFVPAVILAGVTNVTVWTIAMTMTMQFGGESERPLYIGMANSLTAPATILAPVIGGWMADVSGYTLTFSVSIAAGLLMAVTLLVLREPQAAPQGAGVATAE